MEIVAVKIMLRMGYFLSIGFILYNLIIIIIMGYQYGEDDGIRSVDDHTPSTMRVIKYDEIHLIQQWYYDKNSTRFEELKEALGMNLMNGHITQIHFIQEPQSVESVQVMANRIYGSGQEVKIQNLFKKKVVIVKSRYRPVKRLYLSDAFRYASKYLQGKIVMVSNLDIYYDDTLRLLKDAADGSIDLSHYVSYFLSRYEPSDNDRNQCDRLRFIGSCDTFIVIPPLPAVLLDKLDKDELYQGSWGIEARLMYEFEEIGIRVRNPCLSVKSWHMHQSGLKNEWMPEVNTENRSRVAWPDYLEAVYEK